MRSLGPAGHSTRAQGRDQVGRADATRMRRQLGPEVATGLGHDQRPDGRADVVLHLASFALAPDLEGGSGKHLLNPLLQFLVRHPEHLQNPITRCYLLLERTLRFWHERGSLHVDPLGQEQRECAGQLGHRRLPVYRLVQPDVEILAERLAAGRQGQAEADERVGREALGVGHGESAAP